MKYVLLDASDIKQSGDEFWNPGKGGWDPVSLLGREVGADIVRRPANYAGIIDSRVAKFAYQLREVEEQNAELTAKVDNQRRQLAQQESAIRERNNLREEVTSLTKELARVRCVNDELNERIARNEVHSTVKINDLQRDVERLRSVITMRNEELEKLDAEAGEIKAFRTNLREFREKYPTFLAAVDRVKELEKQNAELTEKLARRERDEGGILLEWKRRVDRLLEANGKMSARRDALESALSEARKVLGRVAL